MNQETGFVCALGGMVLFGLYMVPKQYTHAPLRVFIFWMGAGIIAASSLIGAAGGFLAVSPRHYVLSFASGFLWAGGNYCYASATEYISFSRATPIKNTNAALTVLFGIVIFDQFTLARPVPLTLALLGTGAVMLSAELLGRVRHSGRGTCQPDDSRCLWTGIGLALTAALAYSVRWIPMEVVLEDGVPAAAFIAYSSQGAFAGNVVACLLLRAPSSRTSGIRDYALSLLSGVAWVVGVLFAALSVSAIGIAVASPIVNLNTIVAVTYGALILREFRISQHRANFWGGFAATLTSVALLAAALELR